VGIVERHLSGDAFDIWQCCLLSSWDEGNESLTDDLRQWKRVLRIVEQRFLDFEESLYSSFLDPAGEETFATVKAEYLKYMQCQRTLLDVFECENKDDSLMEEIEEIQRLRSTLRRFRDSLSNWMKMAETCAWQLVSTGEKLTIKESVSNTSEEFIV
jgi:hypothetical protein